MAEGLSIDKGALNTALISWIEARQEKERLGLLLADAERTFTKANVAEREAYVAVEATIVGLSDPAKEITIRIGTTLFHLSPSKGQAIESLLWALAHGAESEGEGT